MKSLVKGGALILGIILAVAVAAAVVLSLLGYLYGGVKSPSEKVLLQTVACSDADIATYNEFVTNFPGSDEDRAKKAADMTAFSTEILGKDGADSDPTCQFMAYSSAIANDDEAAAKERVARVEELSRQGLFPSNALLDIVSVESMNARVQALGTEEPGSDPLGSG